MYSEKKLNWGKKISLNMLALPPSVSYDISCSGTFYILLVLLRSLVPPLAALLPLFVCF